MAMSKAFAGVELPAEFKRQRCGHMFRATGKAPICPRCKTNAKAKRPALRLVPKATETLVDKAAKALAAASDGALDAIDARIEIERILAGLDVLS